MPEIKLKPRPFCGGAAYLKEFGANDIDLPRGVYRKHHKIGCENCQFYFLEAITFTVDCGELKFIENGWEKCLSRWNEMVSNG